MGKGRLEAFSDGVIAMVHVTADTTWSNLPLSGLFVEMLRKIVGLAGTGPAEPQGEDVRVETLSPTRVLDGQGLGPMPGTAHAGAFSNPRPMSAPNMWASSPSPHTLGMTRAAPIQRGSIGARPSPAIAGEPVASRIIACSPKPTFTVA